jgi:uncharacterized membrane protein YdbT with pleckstrin-like domain
MTDPTPGLSVRTSWKSFLGAFLVSGFLTLVCIGFAISERSWTVALIGLVWPVLAVVTAALRVYGTEFRLYDPFLEVETGILSRRVDQVQLFRVRDLAFHQSILNRLLDVGTVSLSSTDESLPRLEMKGVPGPRAIYRQLQDAVSKSRATQRTMIVESDHP